MAVDKSLQVLTLAGGVGGARLSFGLAELLGEHLTVLVNTGDDFEHLGFQISPDLDTVMYTLAGTSNPETGWGLADESWHFMSQVGRLGGPTWFRLGDRDLAAHAIRTEQLRRGDTLTAVTSELCGALGIRARVLPMSNDKVRTIVHSGADHFSFQDYFVRLQCNVIVSDFSFAGAAAASYNEELTSILASTPLAIVLCPSNPYVSIDPILSLPGLRLAIRKSGAPVIAVSPIIGGAAVKGPAAKMMRELGIVPSPLAIAERFQDLIDGIVIDRADAASIADIQRLGIAVCATQTLMRTNTDRISLARECLALAETVRAGHPRI
jgi:LPPG:FO 2-phospho-L-lactate transferase